MATDNRSDVKLVAMSLEDPDQFGEIVQRYECRLLRYIRRLTNVDSATAEDILQEVFIKVYTHLHDFDQKLKFSSWIYRITHNEVISHFRKKKLETVSLDDDNNTEDNLTLLDLLASDTDTVHEVKQREQAGQVRQIIAKLPDKYRTVLILRYLEEQSYEEIGDILRKPAGTVATLINRAKTRFKQEALKHNLPN